jgi:hypothetical protein
VGSQKQFEAFGIGFLKGHNERMMMMSHIEIIVFLMHYLKEIFVYYKIT